MNKGEKQIASDTFAAATASRQANGSGSPVLFSALSESRKNNFDILRLVLALTVLFSHSFPLVAGNNRFEPMTRFTKGQITLGQLAVDAFFVISGFLIVQSWLRNPNLLAYFQKRVFRIYPGFIAASLLSFCLILPFVPLRVRTYVHQLQPFSIVSSALRLKLPPTPPVFNILPDHAINGSLWTIHYEFVCYLLIALLGLVGLLRHRHLILGLFLASLFLLLLEYHVGNPMPALNTNTVTGVFHGASLPLIGELDILVRLLTDFLGGMVFFLYRERIPCSPKFFAAACVLTLFCLGAGLYGLLPVFGTYIILYFAFRPVQYGLWITRHGDFSYGIYLYAFPAQQAMMFWLGPHLNPYTLFLLALPLTLGLAFLSWNFIEKPFLKRKKSGEAKPSFAMPSA